LRIINGTHKGRKLTSVPGWKTRPTSDRIKESIFNILPVMAPETLVLDLFAGTGSFSLEALSRGASYAVLIDNASPAIKVIKRNLAICDLLDRSKVIMWDILRNLNCLIGLQKRFNLIFMDPPYNQQTIAPVMNHLSKSLALADSAKIIIEHSIEEPLPILPQQYILDDQRRYGKTLVSFLTYML
jgi:16S rRNA (guanine966-N2)-methyltransferase